VVSHPSRDEAARRMGHPAVVAGTGDAEL